MKKLVIGTVLAVAAAVSFAADVSVSAVHDVKSNANGVRVATSVPLGLTASVTALEGLGNRVALGKEVTVATFGPVALGANVSGVYQNSHGPVSNGYGLTVGAGATYAITKNVKAFVGVERFFGQDRISQFNGGVASIGVNARF